MKRKPTRCKHCNKPITWLKSSTGFVPVDGNVDDQHEAPLITKRL